MSLRKQSLLAREMTDLLLLDLVEKQLVTGQVVLTIGYDIENLKDPQRAKSYKGAVTTDHYGHSFSKHAHGTQNLDRQTSAGSLIKKAVIELFNRIIGTNLLVHRINICVNHLVPEDSVQDNGEQLTFFTDYEVLEREKADFAKERNQQKVILSIRKRFGKNAILPGMNFKEGTTAKERNGQSGVHKA